MDSDKALIIVCYSTHLIFWKVMYRMHHCPIDEPFVFYIYIYKLNFFHQINGVQNILASFILI